MKSHFDLNSSSNDNIHPIISIGDSNDEYTAAEETKQMISTMNRLNGNNNVVRCHRIKLKDGPTIKVMLQQIGTLMNDVLTMLSKEQTISTQILWHSMMEMKGQIVAVSTTSGETYSGILFCIEPTPSTPNGTNGSTKMNKIVLKNVQKMSDSNDNAAERMKAEYKEELIIPASEFAALSAMGIPDHSNSYCRADGQAFDGRSMHREERPLERRKAGGGWG